MNMAILVFGVFIIAMCIWGAIAPKPMINRVLSIWHQPWGLFAAVGIRLGLGILFLQAATQTRHPGVFELLGYLMIFAAIVIALAGRKRIDRFIKYWMEQPTGFLQAWLVIGIGFGAFIVYSVTGV